MRSYRLISLLIATCLCGIASSDDCTKIIYVFVDAKANKDSLANLLPPKDKAQIYAISTGVPGQDDLEHFVGNQAQRTVMKDPDNIHKAIGEFQEQKCVIGESNPKVDLLPKKNRTRVKIGNKIREKKNMFLTLDSSGPRSEFEAVKRLAIINLYTRSLGGDGLNLHLVTNIGNEVKEHDYIDEAESLANILEIAEMEYNDGTKVKIVEILKIIRERYEKLSKEDKAGADLLLSANMDKSDKKKLGDLTNFLKSGETPIMISGGAAGLWLDMIPNAEMTNVADLADVKTGEKEKWQGAHIMVIDNSADSGKVAFESAKFHVNHLLDSSVIGKDGLDLNIAYTADGKAKQMIFNKQEDVEKDKKEMKGMKFSIKATSPDLIFGNLLGLYDKVKESGPYNRSNLVIEIPANMKPPTDEHIKSQLRDMGTGGLVRFVSDGIAVSTMADWHDIIPNMQGSTSYLNHGNNLFEAINKNILKKDNKVKIIKAKTVDGEIFIRPSDEEGAPFKFPASELNFKDKLSLLPYTNVIENHDGTIIRIRQKDKSFEDSGLLMEIKDGKLVATVKTTDGKAVAVQTKDVVAKGPHLLGFRMNANNGIMALSIDGRINGVSNVGTFKANLDGNVDLLGPRTLLSTAAITASDLMSFKNEAKARVEMNQMLEQKKYDTGPIPTRYHNFFREPSFDGNYFINTKTIGDKFMVTDANVGLGNAAFTVGAYFKYATTDGTIMRLQDQGQAADHAHFGMKIDSGRLDAWMRAPDKKHVVNGSATLKKGWHFGCFRYNYDTGMLYLTLDGALVGQASVGKAEWLNAGDLYLQGKNFLDLNAIFIDNTFMDFAKDKDFAGPTLEKWLKKYGYNYTALKMETATLSTGEETEAATEESTVAPTTTAAAAAAGIGASSSGSGWFRKRRRRRRVLWT